MSNLTRFSLALVASCLLAQPLSAQESREARAEAAFREGKRQLAAGAIDEACTAFERSQSLAPASGTLLNLADCYERQGRTASAWSTFRASAATAREKGSEPRVREALARANALEPRLAKLRIVVPEDAVVAGLLLQRDDVPVDEMLWGIAVPVDPGDHEIRAVAPAHAAFSRRVSVADDAGTVEVIVPVLSPTEPRASDGLSPQWIFGLVVGSIGVATIGAALGVGIDAMVKNGESNDAGCRDDLCTPQGLALRDTAVTQAHVATGLAVAGLVHVAAGLAVVLTAPEFGGPEVAADERGFWLGWRGSF